jgi:hypothetical protein
MIFRRIILTISVGAATAVLSAIIITIFDLYLSGHGYVGLTREYLTWSAAGVHLSIGDIIMLGTALLAAALVWGLYGRDA